MALSVERNIRRILSKLFRHGKNVSWYFENKHHFQIKVPKQGLSWKIKISELWLNKLGVGIFFNVICKTEQHSIDFKPCKFKHIIYLILSRSKPRGNTSLSISLAIGMEMIQLDLCLVPDIMLWNFPSKSDRGGAKMDTSLAYHLELSATLWSDCTISCPQSMVHRTTCPRGRWPSQQL